MAGSAGTLYVDVLPRTAGFSGALRGSLASTATKGLALGIGLVGVASMKMATDFQTAMTRVQTQAGASAADVKTLSTQVLDLAGVSQQGPVELANALYHLKSVGMDNVSAMSALKQSSDLAAVSGADLESVTNALAGAWRSGISGATDFHSAVATLNAIVGAGNMRMQDLTAAIGTGVLPAAKAFGLTLTDVGAALAVLTDSGMSADSAATRLRMTFSLLAAPTAKAQGILKGIGLSSLDLAHAMRGPDGLLGALQLLHDHLQQIHDPAKQAALLSQAFGGGRSSAALLTLIQNLDVLDSKYKQIRDTTANFDRDVAAQAKTTAAQIALAGSTLQVMATKLGQALLPVFNGLLKGLSAATPEIIAMVAAFATYKAIMFIPALIGGIKSAVQGMGVSMGLAATATEAETLAAEAAALRMQALTAATAESAAASIADAAAKETEAAALSAAGASGAAGLSSLLGPFALAAAAAIGFKMVLDQVSATLDKMTKDAIAQGGAALDEYSKKIDSASGKFHGWLGSVVSFFVPGGKAVQGSLDDQKAALERHARAVQRDIQETGTQTRANIEVGRSMNLVAGRSVAGALAQQHLARNAGQAASQIQQEKQSMDEAHSTLDRFNAATGQALDLTAKTPKILDAARSAYRDLATGIAGSVNSIFTRFDALAQKPKSTFEELAKATRQGIQQMRAFGKDLSTIGRDARAGVPGARDLLQHLVALGPAGAHAADVIARATPKARHALEHDIGGGMQDAQNIGQQMAQAIAGSLDRIGAAILVATGKAKTFKAALDRIHDVHATITAEANTADALAQFHALIATIESANPTVHVNLDTSLHGGGGLTGHAAGGYLPAGLSIVGEKGPELFYNDRPGFVVPHDKVDWSGGSSKQGTGALTMVRGTLDITDRGQAFIRGLAREEAVDEMGYRGLIP